MYVSRWARKHLPSLIVDLVCLEGFFVDYLRSLLPVDFFS